MTGISSPGVGSGLPLSDLINKLVDVEITPVQNRIDVNRSFMSAELSMIGQIKSSLSKLQDSLIKLSDIEQFYGFAANSSDTSILGAKAGQSAQAGEYQISVEQLATRHSLASSAISDPSASLGNGTLTIDFGTYNADKSNFTLNPEQSSVVITIDNGNDSLEAIRDQINNSDSGVTASIISDSLGAHLTITSASTGENMALRISVSDNDGNHTDGNGLSALTYDPTLGVNNMTETVAAQNSEVYVNGLFLTNYSNELKGVIDGVDLTLKKADPGNLINLGITQDKAKMTDAVNQFIKQYNEVMGVLNKYTGYNKETNEGTFLQGDVSMQLLKSSLSRWVSQSLNTSGTLQSIADIGIHTNRDNLLEIDLEDFNNALDNHYEEIGALFAKTGTVSDSGLRIKHIDRAIPAGKYDIVIDTFNPGTELTGTIGGVYANSPDGHILTGTGKFKGLEIDVSGGGTGARGTIDIHDGLAVRLDDILESYLGDKGNLTSRTKQLNERLDNLNTEQERLDARAERIEQRYLKQFTALDTLISQMQSISDFLTNQLPLLSELKIKK